MKYNYTDLVILSTILKKCKENNYRRFKFV